jgi:hypothetical protein
MRGLAFFVVLLASGCQYVEPDALCTTDTECMAFCPVGTADLPPDHPDYCDGGPDPVVEFHWDVYQNLK